MVKGTGMYEFYFKMKCLLLLVSVLRDGRIVFCISSKWRILVGDS